MRPAPVSQPPRPTLRSFTRLLGLIGLTVGAAVLPVHAADPAPTVPATAMPAPPEGTADKPATARRLLRAALKDAASIKDPEGQANALSTLALTLAEAGDTALAVEAAGGIKDVSTRVGALVGVSSSVVKAGKADLARDILARAKTAAGSIKNPEDRNTELAIIANAQIEAGDKAGVQETAAALTPAPSRSARSVRPGTLRGRAGRRRPSRTRKRARAC